MNELEMYDIMKNPEKYDHDIQLDNIYRGNDYIFVEFSSIKFTNITFVLNQKKELQRIYFFEGAYFDVVRAETSLDIKEAIEELWQYYMKKYNLRIKFLFI